jgi:hypothetical protein
MKERSHCAHLRGKLGKTLKIIVDGLDNFQLKYDLGNKGGLGQIRVTTQMAPPDVRGSRPEMISRVKAWRNIR